MSILNGVVVGAIYALMALGFVVTYKTLRVVNFALGDFIVFGSGLTALAYGAAGVSLWGALGCGMAGMALFAAAFNRLVAARVAHARPIALLAVTIGVGAFLRGLAGLLFRGVSLHLPVPLPAGTVSLDDVPFAWADVAVGALALVGACGVGALFAWTRFGLALRTLAEDPQTAQGMGIDVRRYGTIAWALAGAIAVVDGVLWSALKGPGFGLAIVSLKVFPIVIIGGLDSLGGAVVGGMLVGVVESLAATYLDRWAGGGFSTSASFLLLIAMLMVRPQGLFGSAIIERV